MFAMFEYIGYNMLILLEKVLEEAMRRPATDINSRQIKILNYIATCIQQEFYTPSVREICEHVGLSSSSSVQSHLDTLEKFGYIWRNPNKNRSIKILKMPEGMEELLPGTAKEEPALQAPSMSLEEIEIKGRSMRRVPLIGTVQAGTPITAVENYEDELLLPVALTGNSDCFMLRVQGDSMIEMGMFEGDMLIVRQQSTANNGDVVVALVDDEATVKRFYKENGHFRLQPENQDFAPIIVDHCEIQGKVIGLIRDRL